MDSLLFNAILFVSTFLFFFKKIKRINTFLFLLGANTVVAILGYITVVLEIHPTENANLGYSLSIVPFLFNYIFTLIICSPFYKYDENDINLFPIFKSRNMRYLIYAIIYFVVLMLIVKGIEAWVMSKLDASAIYEQRRDGLSINIWGNGLLSNIINLCYGIYISIYSIIILYSISQYRVYMKSKYLLLIILAIAPRILGGMSAASRGDFFFTIFELSFFYFIIRQYLSHKNKLFIFVSITSIVLITFLYSLLITESRFSGSSRSARLNNTESILKYFGEAQVNYGYYIYDKVSKNPMGERMFHLNMSRKFNNINDERDYWDLYTNIPIRVFKTASGDCYVEYGLFGSFIFLLIFVALWKFYIFSRYSKYYIIPFVYFYFHICFFAIFDFYFTYRAFQGLIILSFACYFLKKSS